MFVKIPYSASSPHLKLNAFNAHNELVLTLDIRWAHSSPEAIYSYPIPEDAVKFELDGNEFTPELSDSPEVKELSESYPETKITFSPPYGWNNDPNGLFYYNGVWHMFYQHNPVGAVWGNMHWRHAVSDDLVHWDDKGLTLYPDDMGTMFSGSAIVDYENASGLGAEDSPAILLFYTAAGDTNLLSQGKYFTQCLAYSTDGGESFKKYENNPVIGPISKSTRDPKVIRDGHGGYLLGLFRDEPDGMYLLFTSSNLINWELKQTFKLGPDSECPDLYPLTLGEKTRWIYSGASDFYYVGDMEDGNFSYNADEIHRLGRDDCGYAAQTWSDAPDNRRVKIWWNRWEGIREKGIRRCTMSTPCDISLKNVNGKEKLAAEIVPEIYQNLNNVKTSNFKSGDTIAEDTTLLLEIDTDSPIELKVNGAHITVKPDKMVILGKESPVESPFGKITVFRDGLNLQIHAEENTFFVMAAHDPSEKETVLVDGKAKITVYTL